MMEYITDFTQLGTDKEICWTNTRYGEDTIKEVPFIELLGYEQDWGVIKTSIDAWWARVSDPISMPNPYKDLYRGVEKHAYKLPYLSETHHNISQNWDTHETPATPFVKRVTDYVTTLGKSILPAAEVLLPKVYAGSSAAPYSFTINLINTNACGGNITDLIMRNKNFIDNFINDNLHDQNNALSIVPPLIYEVYIPGIKWSPASVVSGLTINNKGTININSGKKILPELPENYIYPDIWEVTITITDLIRESKKLWKDAIGGANSVSDSLITTRTIKST